MSWLLQNRDQSPSSRFREILNNPGVIKVPGAHDGLSAILAKKTGFEVLYLSGGAFSASKGIPDVGLVTLSELAEKTKELYRATNIPILVDIDTGFGSILNVIRTIRELEESGAAAVQIEDQDLPKKCGHLNGKILISEEEMVQKIQACRQASKDMVIVARTDAFSVEGMEQAIKRAKAYEKAGADIIFPEALRTKEDFIQFSKEISIPLLANMTEFGKTPYYSAKQFEEWGYKLIIYPVSSLRVAAYAVEELFKDIYNKGTQVDQVKNMQTREDLYQTIEYYAYEDLDNTIAKTVLESQKG
ncbi:methylisocitrate lyase [Psychrobacillus antarcticus]|uniref:methylisocitrate lyase n=1 Tax=Psychrobacillus antarcticus TaxID=2879115 RepID=UPI002408578A|nr:methylisocitrate lyase [Psychrobacillus antarcticus]